MLGLGDNLDFKRDSNRFNPSRNLGFNCCLQLLMSCITSSSLEGEGRAKASNPEKSFKMLSVTFWCPFSSLVAFSNSLKT